LMVPLDIRVSLSTYTCPGARDINFHSTREPGKLHGFAAERKAQPQLAAKTITQECPKTGAI
ncbi:MAG: hypothetical protein ACRD2I_05720, partial [Vicinamibacterales bacterium]